MGRCCCPADAAVGVRCLASSRAGAACLHAHHRVDRRHVNQHGPAWAPVAAAWGRSANAPRHGGAVRATGLECGAGGRRL